MHHKLQSRYNHFDAHVREAAAGGMSWTERCCSWRSNFALAESQRRLRKEIAMNWNIIEGNWNLVKGMVKDYWGHLTDEDLDKIAEKREQLERYGLSRDFVRWDVDDWLKGQ
jgi:uncharacterized protein YjbJ (UPF0337 family)